MDVVLRADASATMGVGHLSRVLTLAGALRAVGARCTIATCRPEASTAAWIAREGHQLLPLDEIADPAELLGRAPSWFVVDGYHLDSSYRRALGALGKLAVLDDLGEGVAGADVVLNGNLYGAELAYQVPRSTKLLLGPRYALVRDEFLRARAARSERKASADGRPRILVTMGGSDPTRATEAALSALQKLPSSEIRLAVGAANAHRAAIMRAAGDAAHHRVEVLVDAPMGDCMSWCDVVLTAAGSTCLELACVGVAGVAVAVVSNQYLVREALRRHRLLATVDAVEDAAEPLAALMADVALRRSMEDAQRALVDGRGKERVAAELMSQVDRA